MTSPTDNSGSVDRTPAAAATAATETSLAGHDAVSAVVPPPPQPHLRHTHPLPLHHFDKILVANRGEIAIRIIRAAHELGIQAISVYSHEDRLCMHRYKADEAYQIGGADNYKKFTPVGAYLAQDEIIAIAKAHGASAIHPGYGFLSENAEFARKVTEAGLAFIGPTHQVIDRLGSKTQARQIAVECGVPVVPGTDSAIVDVAEVEEFVAKHGLPASMGGGGRGMRVVRELSELKDAFQRATNEALTAFGDGSVFVERFLDKPKHIEVQLLGDHYGNIIHLYERDCSVQRRHQKVVEIAPAPDLAPAIRDAILADAVKIAHHTGYRNAGTAEFLVDRQGRHYFIEVNPRIQVEHVISEEILGIDIVSAQIQIAAGYSLGDLGLKQERIRPRGFAIQCRVTTEDPERQFSPDTGRIEVYRSPGGPGIRLDGSQGYTGAVITPHYDSLLVKVTSHGNSFEKARRRLLSALVEFRVRGVKTNIPFMLNLLSHETFRAGGCWTTFIDDTPALFSIKAPVDRVQKILHYLGDVLVNGSRIKGQVGEPKLLADIVVPALPGSADVRAKPTAGWRKILVEQGPEAFARAIRNHKGTLLMDTTWRDAHQSLLATRVRTIDMAKIAPATAHAFSNLFSCEMWGGATFDVSLRFLHEDPWDRLMALRELVPNIPFQMLLRGANAVGYTSYPDNVVYDFCAKAVKSGMDIFRVFDSLNYVENLKLGIDAVRAAGGVVEAAICYTGDVANPEKHPKHDLEYYLGLVRQLVSYGIHILAIKDMAGLLRPRAARLLVGAIRKEFPDLPIHVHTHDTAGTGVASMLAAAEAGADVVDAAVDSMSGVTSQPAMGAIVGALEGTPLDTGIKFENVLAINSYWEQVRLLYSCFDPGLKSSDSGVYDHEMPGGQYTNLLFQAQSLGLGTQWEAVKRAYAEANMLCGDIVKVTPSSKVIGDLAQFMVSQSLNADEVRAKARTLSFPTSVVEFFQGYLGQPHGGFPEPLRSDIIRELPRIDARPGATMAPFDFDALRKSLEAKYGGGSGGSLGRIRDVDLSSAALYPKVFEEYMETRRKFGDLSILPTRFFLAPVEMNEEFTLELGPGRSVILKLVAIGKINSKGFRDVFFEMNGEVRALSIEDTSETVVHQAREKANPANEGDVGAPMAGVVVEVRVKPGGIVKMGDPVAVLSAMKMETVVTAPIHGKVETVPVHDGDSLSAGDLVVRLTKVTSN
ncbi:pyruvate carboxylase [Ramicandelaber brevisporus]|nr:pyruvate carboxylase [Ramicandelaber brevisporus]